MGASISSSDNPENAGPQHITTNTSNTTTSTTYINNGAGAGTGAVGAGTGTGATPANSGGVMGAAARLLGAADTSNQQAQNQAVNPAQAAGPTSMLHLRQVLISDMLGLSHRASLLKENLSARGNSSSAQFEPTSRVLDVSNDIESLFVTPIALVPELVTVDLEVDRSIGDEDQEVTVVYKQDFQKPEFGAYTPDSSVLQPQQNAAEQSDSSDSDDDLGVASQRDRRQARAAKQQAQRAKAQQPRRVKTFKIDKLLVGENVFYIIVRSQENPLQLQKHAIYVNRRPWDLEGWKKHNPKASVLEKYEWFNRGAQQGYAQAQYSLALMYATKRGIDLVRWERELMERKIDGKDTDTASLDSAPSALLQPDDDSGAAHGHHSDLKDIDPTLDRGMGLSSSMEIKLHTTSASDSSSPRRRGSVPDVDDDDNGGSEPEEDWDAPDTHPGPSLEEEFVDDADAEDRELAMMRQYTWLTASARQDYIPALYRLANLYYLKQVPRERLREELAMESVRTSMQYEDRRRLTSRPSRNNQESAFSENEFYSVMAARWFEACAELGDVRSAYQLALMHINGEGVQMNFNRAKYFLDKAFVPETVAQKMIQKKFDDLKPKYQALYDFHNQGNPRPERGMNKDLFANFYVGVLCASGHSETRAEQIANARYQGKYKSEVIFDALDVNNDHHVTFEELWRHTHTRTALVPRREDQLIKAETFFKKFFESISDEHETH
jgi:TPR repeat protein